MKFLIESTSLLYMIHSKRKDHLKALIRNRLKITSKKCILFRQKLTDMGQTLLIKDKILRIDTVQRL